MKSYETSDGTIFRWYERMPMDNCGMVEIHNIKAGNESTWMIKSKKEKDKALDELIMFLREGRGLGGEYEYKSLLTLSDNIYTSRVLTTVDVINRMKYFRRKRKLKMVITQPYLNINSGCDIVCAVVYLNGPHHRLGKPSIYKENQ